MNLDKYYILFHESSLNLVAFKRVVECSAEILALVNAAIAAERKEWVGLTDEEVLLIYRDQSNQDFQMRLDPFKLYAAFEAKLKEKNT